MGDVSAGLRLPLIVDVHAPLHTDSGGVCSHSVFTATEPPGPQSGDHWIALRQCRDHVYFGINPVNPHRESAFISTVVVWLVIFVLAGLLALARSVLL